MVGKHPAKFSGGPIFHSLGSSVQIWAIYETDLEIDDEETKRLKGTPAVIADRYGQGRVVAFSPHCERAPGPQELFWEAIRWSAGRPVIDR